MFQIQTLVRHPAIVLCEEASANNNPISISVPPEELHLGNSIPLEMALDLSMKSDRRLVDPSRSASSSPAGLSPQDSPLALVTEKRVRFAHEGLSGMRGGSIIPRYHHHPYGHHGSRVWRRAGGKPLPPAVPCVVDSDEENRPPSTASTSSSGSSANSDWDSQLSGSEEVNVHPATRTSHMTLPVRIESDVNIHALPLDPRDWSRSDVSDWLTYMKSTHNLHELRPERFLMNGKALCLMNANMFSYRVPNGGKLLYRDFRMRLARALASQSAPTSFPVVAVETTSASYVTPPAQA